MVFWWLELLLLEHLCLICKQYINPGLPPLISRLCLLAVWYKPAYFLFQSSCFMFLVSCFLAVTSFSCACSDNQQPGAQPPLLHQRPASLPQHSASVHTSLPPWSTFPLPAIHLFFDQLFIKSLKNIFLSVVHLELNCQRYLSIFRLNIYMHANIPLFHRCCTVSLFPLFIPKLIQVM